MSASQRLFCNSKIAEMLTFPIFKFMCYLISVYTWNDKIAEILTYIIFKFINDLIFVCNDNIEDCRQHN